MTERNKYDRLEHEEFDDKQNQTNPLMNKEMIELELQIITQEKMPNRIYKKVAEYRSVPKLFELKTIRFSMVTFLHEFRRSSNEV